jgi:hypothetical protein
MQPIPAPSLVRHRAEVKGKFLARDSYPRQVMIILATQLDPLLRGGSNSSVLHIKHKEKVS